MIVYSTSGLQTFPELHYSCGPEDSAYAEIDYACHQLCMYAYMFVCMYVCMYICTYKGVRLKYQLQHTAT